MKKKKISAVLRLMLAIVLIAGIAAPAASASANVSIEFLNPLGDVDVQHDVGLSERLETIVGARILVANYSKVANAEALRALGLMLQAEGAIVTFDTTTMGVWNQYTPARYDYWASFDAVVMGVSD